MTTYADPEDQVAAEIAAMEAKGLDPYADNSAPVAPDADDAPLDTPEPAAPAVTDEPPAEDAPAAQTEPAQPAPAINEPQAFSVQMPADMAAQRLELMQAKGAAMKQLMDGEIDAEQYAVTDADITAKLEDLASARIRAETLAEMNRQQAQTHQAREIQKLIARTRSEVDYANDIKATRQFDTALQLIGADPDNANLPYSELIQLSHEMVAAMRGVAPSKPPIASKTAPDRTPPKPPITLSGLPTAAASGAQSVSQVVGRLAGDDLERAFDSMSDVEFKKLLRG